MYLRTYVVSETSWLALKYFSARTPLKLPSSPTLNVRRPSDISTLYTF